MSLELIHTYLKHILPKNLFVNLPPSFTDNIAKVRKVNKSIFGNCVAKVHDVDKVEDPKGDRVEITMCGKFLPYKKW